jgi:hypothetical protein
MVVVQYILVRVRKTLRLKIHSSTTATQLHRMVHYTVGQRMAICIGIAFLSALEPVDMLSILV